MPALHATRWAGWLVASADWLPVVVAAVVLPVTVNQTEHARNVDDPAGGVVALVGEDSADVNLAHRELFH